MGCKTGRGFSYEADGMALGYNHDRLPYMCGRVGARTQEGVSQGTSSEGLLDGDERSGARPRGRGLTVIL